MSIKQLNVINENTDKYGIMEVCPIKPIRSSMGGGAYGPLSVFYFGSLLNMILFYWA